MTDIKEVSNKEDISLTAKLAYKIWNYHFVPIIGQDQVDYMIEKFQSEAAITDQLNTGYEYYLLYHDGTAIAYLALVPNVEEGKMMISKIYMDPKSKGAGFGKQLLQFVEKQCKERNFSTIWLTVNKYNYETIEWYKRRGFIVTDDKVMDIGNGYVMDDYFMELKLV